MNHVAEFAEALPIPMPLTMGTLGKDLLNKDDRPSKRDSNSNSINESFVKYVAAEKKQVQIAQRL